jgi:hypothetical protein
VKLSMRVTSVAKRESTKGQRHHSMVKISHTTLAIYSSGKNPLLEFLARDPSGLKTRKGPVSPHSKPAQVALHHNLCTESIKLVKSFGHNAFKGEGDAFLRKRTQGNARSPKPSVAAKTHQKLRQPYVRR